ncbi:hypothetical protein COT42_07330 [Candidatus Saganbacteria bacterium CG08_land_8_20_14_0_20_45_16]|uniref:Uncharacterized protein n=1 Tax=Candidatus Saganbacteria bacterium CG08_land_8_20_14_0_20_45_16 TaxID=2014293 RepID=A0A2H0XV85_UNCSA|nr:MAG: hypothetical protein COT42_07330 [Candidatus Saganbacteria bacterium CG08_land_8_20_14_0_20_45_16]
MYSYSGRLLGLLDSCFLIINAFFLLVLVGLFVWLADRELIPKKIMTTVIVVVFTLALILGFAWPHKLKDWLNQGAIMEVFVQKSGQEIEVWLSRPDNDQLKVFNLKSGQQLSIKELPKKERWNGKLGWVSRNDRFSDPGWGFRADPNGRGEYLHKQGEPLSADSKVLLKPRLVEELNKTSGTKNKIWVAHQSAIFGPYENLVSFLDNRGQATITINLNQLLKKGKIKPAYQYVNPGMVQAMATYSKPDEVWLFITCGETSRSAHYGFTLSALRLEPQSGQAIGQVDYLK